MFVSKLKIVAAIALTAALVVGTSVAASGRVQDQGTNDKVTQSTDNDEPKKKDEPKEKKDEPKEEGPRAFLGINYMDDQEDGPPEVSGLFEDGPAAKAGIKEGDKIIKVGDKEIKDISALAKVMSTLKPGQKVTVKVKRDNKEIDIKVTLGTRPPDQP